MNTNLELTTAGDVAAWLGDTTLGASDLNAYILAAERRMAVLCNRLDEPGGFHWSSRTRTEFIDGEYADSLLLTWNPVSAVSAVSIVHASGSAQTITLTDLTVDGIEIADLSASNPGRRGRLIYRWGTAPNIYGFEYGHPLPGDLRWNGPVGLGGGRRRVKVQYTGGYAAVPDDLAWAATVWAGLLYQRRNTDPTMRSERLGDYEYTRADASAPIFAGVPDEVAAVLQNYVRVRF